MKKLVFYFFGLVNILLFADSFTISNGWNLVGATVHLDLNRTFSPYPQITVIWSFDNQKKDWVAYGNIKEYQQKIVDNSYFAISKIKKSGGFWIFNNGGDLNISVQKVDNPPTVISEIPLITQNYFKINLLDYFSDDGDLKFSLICDSNISNLEIRNSKLTGFIQDKIEQQCLIVATDILEQQAKATINFKTEKFNYNDNNIYNIVEDFDLSNGYNEKGKISVELAGTLSSKILSIGTNKSPVSDDNIQDTNNIIELYLVEQVGDMDNFLELMFKTDEYSDEDIIYIKLGDKILIINVGSVKNEDELIFY